MCPILEIFGLWGLANRAAAILGPISYGVISELSGGNYPLAMLSTLGFFVLGLMLLFSVDEERGKLAAAALTTQQRRSQWWQLNFSGQQQSAT